MNTTNPMPNDAGSEPQGGAETPVDPSSEVQPEAPTTPQAQWSKAQPAQPAQPEQPAQSEQPAHWAHAAAPAAPATPATPAAQPQKPRPSTGPIIWGAMVLAFCLFVAQRAVAPDAIDGVTWLIAGVIGLGVLLLAVGVAVLVRNGTNK